MGKTSTTTPRPFRPSRPRAPLVIVVLLVLAAGPASGQASPPLFLVDAPFDSPQTSRLYTIDPLSGALSLRAELGEQFTPILGLAAASASVLYATGSDGTGTTCDGSGFACLLLRIELAPGSTTPLSIVPIGQVATPSGEALDNLVGLTFRGDGVLYGIDQSRDGLYRIDPATGAATLVGVSNVDLYGGDITFDDQDRLWLWTNAGPPSGLYEMDASTAQATLRDARAGLTLAGMAAVGHGPVSWGASPFQDLLHEIAHPAGLTGASLPLTLGGSPFDHKRGDLDSPFCSGDSSCGDGNPCTTDLCTPGGCRHLFRDTSCNGVDDDCDGSIDEDVPPVTETPYLTVVPGFAGEASLSWSALSLATAYDVVRGRLSILHASGGDFAIATEICLENDRGATTASDASALPPGEGYWYLTRGVNACTGPGSYDSLQPSQVGSRDPGIASSLAACP